MDSKSLREALLDGDPVIYNGVEYQCISAIIYRRVRHGMMRGKVVLQAELLSKSGNSVTYAAPHRLMICKEAPPPGDTAGDGGAGDAT